ncbi:hypothetical protein C8R48DRAFT_768941 [Suillus tomentosus]|nr:hypothetical protein C8R48DRAFT_768941 [Suillus tomentosus]
MSYTQLSIDSDLHPFACEIDTITPAYISRSCTPDTPHSHDFEPCLGGQAHGQGAPVYSCGCYRRTKVEPAQALADVSEQDQILEQIWPLKHKRSRSESIFESDSIGDRTSRHFGKNLTNVQRAESVPALEMSKRRKLGKAFEFNGTTTDETLVLNAVKHLETAIDRQTEVLSKIYRVLESRAK